MNSKIIINYYYKTALLIGLTGYYFSTTMFVYKIGAPILFLLIELSYAMMVFKIFALDRSVEEIVFFLILSVLFGLSTRNSGDSRLLILVAYILSSKGIKFEEILRTYIGTISIELIFTIVCSLVGIVPNLAFGKHSGGISFALGSVYTTNFCAHIFYIVLAYATLKHFDFRFFEKIVVFLVGSFVLFFESARLDGFLIYGILLIAIYPKLVKIPSKIRLWILIIVEMLIMLSMLFLSYIYTPTNSILVNLDKLLTNRLFEGWQAFTKYTLMPFGQSIKMLGMGGESQASQFLNNYFYIDSSYVQIAFLSGIVSFIIVVIVTIIHSVHLYKSKMNVLIISLVLVLISSMIDDLFLNISYNIFLLSVLSDKRGFKVGNS